MSKFLKGFSLIEFLVGILISSLISIIILKIFAQVNLLQYKMSEVIKENRQIIDTYRIFKNLTLKANYGYFRPMSDYKLSETGVFRYGIFSDLSLPGKLKNILASEVLKIAYLEECSDDLKKMTFYAIIDLQKGESFMKGNNFDLFRRYTSKESKILKITEVELYLIHSDNKDGYYELYIMEDHLSKKKLINKVKELKFRFGDKLNNFNEKDLIVDWDKIKYLEVNLSLQFKTFRWIFNLENKL